MLGYVGQATITFFHILSISSDAKANKGSGGDAI
jgi:hypothetical protein